MWNGRVFAREAFDGGISCAEIACMRKARFKRSKGGLIVCWNNSNIQRLLKKEKCNNGIKLFRRDYCGSHFIVGLVVLSETT